MLFILLELEFGIQLLFWWIISNSTIFEMAGIK